MSKGLKAAPWEKIHRELGVSALDFDDRPPGTFVEIYAESIPTNTALRYYDRDISYAELNVLANRLANALVSLGVGPGEVIGVHMPNIPQYVITLIAASKIGVALSGVSPLLAPAELTRQIDDAGIKVLLSLNDLANSTLASLGRLPACVTAVVITGANDLRQPEALQLPDLPGVACHTYLGITSDASSAYQQSQLPPDHVLLIQYTGGTTGPSKGAQLTLRGCMHNAEVNQVYSSWEIGDFAVNASPLFHIAGMMMAMMAIRSGACYLLVPDARVIDYFRRREFNTAWRYDIESPA